ncbi:hypothetical protein FKB36_04425 [Methanoculleus sp. Afa-1]|uniref:Uncharacterized protein n=1 Tax=Methanoculleus formosensis TaxID=2590886 RepID=A0A9E4ZIU9_9EURY|nr:hypothetical protein [Methanoculleus sp. Afa-1]MCT8336752.1 hypothetical protein [Methanoculleus sp. Afa-1]
MRTGLAGQWVRAGLRFSPRALFSALERTFGARVQATSRVEMFRELRMKVSGCNMPMATVA